jgi:menaquinone-dependent protoporphyrinogen oxidase
MKILIAYATNEGHTRKIAETAAAQIKDMGHKAVLHDVDKPHGDLQPGQFDKIIVAGSVHDHQHQEALDLFVFANREAIEKKPTLLISVSMAAAFEESVTDAEGYVEKFCKSTAWRPSSQILVAGALRHGKYGYHDEMTLRHRVLADHAIENPDADQEFTDWESLAGSVAKFVG